MSDTQTQVNLTDLHVRWNRWAHGMDPDLPDYPMNIAEFRAMAEELRHLRGENRRLRSRMREAAGLLDQAQRHGSG